MKITMHYDFIDEVYLDGRETFEFTMKDYKYTTKLKKKDQDMSIKDIYDLYRDSAKQEAAYAYMNGLGDFMSKIN